MMDTLYLSSLSHPLEINSDGVIAEGMEIVNTQTLDCSANYTTSIANFAFLFPVPLLSYPLIRLWLTRLRHQTEIVNGTHPGAGARSLYTRHVRASMLPKKET